MARTFTRADIRTAVRERAEIRDNYIGDTALNEMINQSIAELYNQILHADPDYYLDSDDVSVVSGTDTYALDTAFYKARGVDYVQSSTVSVPLERFNWGERHRKYDYATASNFPTDATATRYRIMGSNIRFTPVPNWSGTVRVWFIPAPPDLSDDVTTVDGIAGFEEWVVLDCCIKCLAKEESDVSVFLDAKMRMEDRIKRLASDRDIGEPDRVRDVLKEATIYDGIY